MTSATAYPPRATTKKKRRPAAPVTLDPVTAYARAIIERRPDLIAPMIAKIVGPDDPRVAVVAAWLVVAGRAVRLACQRHLRDLERQRTADFPYYFDRAAAEHIVDFFPSFLTLENGAPFHLPPWLQFCYGSMYGWKRVSDDCRKYPHGFFETGKGTGKTPSAGGIGLYGLAFDDEAYGEIYSTGFDKGQASIILNDAIRMANDSPDLLGILLVDKYNIAHPDSGSYFRAMSSEHRSKSGPRPFYVLSDEIHEHRDGTVVSKAESGFKSRTQPIGLKMTNSGSDRTSYCWQLHQKSMDVLEGTLVDEQWFAYVCHLDPCDACYAEGHRQPKDGCADCDAWTDPAVWPKVAPALGIVIQPKYLQDAIDAALSMPSEFALKRRLNFCIWTQTHKVWISAERWDSCKVESVSAENAALRVCAAGLDPSSTTDLTSFVVAIRHDDPPELAKQAEEVAIEGMNEAGERIRMAFRLDFSVELIPFFWMPEATLIERVRKERIPFDDWHRRGFVFTTTGGAIDHNAIYDFVWRDAWKRFRIQRLGMDENHGRFLFMRLRDDARLGDNIVSVGQAKKLSEAYKFLEILVAHRRLRHNGHPVLTWCFSNAEPQSDRLGAVWIEKPKEDWKRIDGAVASAMAIHQLMALPARRRRSGVMFV